MTINDAPCHFFSATFFGALGRQTRRTPTPTSGELCRELGWDDPIDAPALADRWVSELDAQGVRVRSRLEIHGGACERDAPIADADRLDLVAADGPEDSRAGGGETHGVTGHVDGGGTEPPAPGAGESLQRRGAPFDLVAHGEIGRAHV